MVKLRSVLLNPANRETRDAREAAAKALAPALLTFHARAADLLESEDTGNDRLRAHLGRVDQVPRFWGLAGLSWSTLGRQGCQGPAWRLQQLTQTRPFNPRTRPGEAAEPS